MKSRRIRLIRLRRKANFWFFSLVSYTCEVEAEPLWWWRWRWYLTFAIMRKKVMPMITDTFSLRWVLVFIAHGKAKQTFNKCEVWRSGNVLFYPGHGWMGGWVDATIVDCSLRHEGFPPGFTNPKPPTYDYDTANARWEQHVVVGAPPPCPPKTLITPGTGAPKTTFQATEITRNNPPISHGADSFSRCILQPCSYTHNPR